MKLILINCLKQKLVKKKLGALESEFIKDLMIKKPFFLNSDIVISKITELITTNIRWTINLKLSYCLLKQFFICLNKFPNV